MNEPSASIGATSAAWWTGERVRLYRWLQRTAPELADVYVGGLRILMDETFPGRVHLAAHAMREIANRLRDVLSGIDARPPRYEDQVAQIRKRWEAERLPVGDRRALKEHASPSASGPVRY